MPYEVRVNLDELIENPYPNGTQKKQPIMTNRSISHHFVAKFILNGFKDDQGYLWIGDKLVKRAYSRQHTFDFARDYLNSSYDLSQLVAADGESFHERVEQLRPNRSDRYEKCLEKVDTRAAWPIRDIIEMARDNRRPHLPPERKKRVIEFLLAQERRTPESQQQLFSAIGADDVVDDVIEKTFRKGGHDIPRHLYDHSPFLTEFKQVLEENRMANFSAGDHPILQQKTAAFLQGDWGIAALVIRGRRRSFVIGSRGLTLVASGPLRGTWLPVAPDVAIALTSSRPEGVLLFVDHKQDRLIKAFNESTAFQSRVIAGRSKELVESLRRDCWRRGV